jgi:hypothetical protein
VPLAIVAVGPLFTTTVTFAALPPALVETRSAMAVARSTAYALPVPELVDEVTWL